MVFLWFSHGFPMVFLCVSYVFPVFYVVPMVFYGFFYGYGFPAKKKKTPVPHNKKPTTGASGICFRNLEGQDPVIASRQMQWQGQVLGSARGSHKK